MELIKKIETLLSPILEGTDIFIVSILVKPTNNIKVYLDADDGFSVSKSSSVNKKLRKQIEELELFPEGDYSLEVSSPGIEEPLKWLRQYVKNIGRNIELTLSEVAEGESETLLGKLIAAEEEKVVIEQTINIKKKETKIVEVPFQNISKAVIQISF